MLNRLIAEEIAGPVPAAAAAMTEAILARHGPAVSAVLFYGAGLRDGPDDDALLDFYVLVERYGDIHDGWLAAAANALLPPNVYLMQAPGRGRTLRAKYAVMSLDQFAYSASPQSIQPMIWARFCQPARLTHVRDDAVRERVVAALARAVTTMVSASGGGGGAAMWRRGFTETYACELRPEGKDRAREIYAADAERYDRMAALVCDEANSVPWLVRRIIGKLLNGARLIKALFTYDGALKYALWKIKRHATKQPGAGGI